MCGKSILIFIMPKLWLHSVCYPQSCAQDLRDVSEVPTIASGLPGYAKPRRRKEMECSVRNSWVRSKAKSLSR